MTKLAPSVLALLLGVAPLQAKLDVVATTPDYGALAQAVGGEDVKIVVLAKPTEDPHFVDARPSHLVSLNRADVLIESGADLELGWLPTLVQGARNRDILPGAAGRVLGATGLTLRDVPVALDRSQGDVHGKGNPHFLMDPSNASIVARNLAETFCRLDEPGCATYRANLDRFDRALHERIQRWQTTLAPFRGASIVTYHNTWRYFAERFELRADLFLEPKPGIPPWPAHLARVIGEMKSKGIKVILVEPFQSRRTAETVAGHADASVVDVCQFPGGLDGTDGDYLTMMDANVSAVAAALEESGR